MKSFLSAIFFCFVGCIAFAQMDSSLCAGFKTGNFAYRDDSSRAVLIRRTPTRQEEITKQTGIITKFRIRWISLCTYEIEQVWSNSRQQRKNNGAKTVVLITSVGKDEYTYTCACKDAAHKLLNTGIVYRVP